MRLVAVRTADPYSGAGSRSFSPNDEGCMAERGEYLLGISIGDGDREPAAAPAAVAREGPQHGLHPLAPHRDPFDEREAVAHVWMRRSRSTHA